MLRILCICSWAMVFVSAGAADSEYALAVLDNHYTNKPVLASYELPAARGQASPILEAALLKTWVIQAESGDGCSSLVLWQYEEDDSPTLYGRSVRRYVFDGYAMPRTYNEHAVEGAMHVKSFPLLPEHEGGTFLSMLMKDDNRERRYVFQTEPGIRGPAVKSDLVSADSIPRFQIYGDSRQLKDQALTHYIPAFVSEKGEVLIGDDRIETGVCVSPSIMSEAVFAQSRRYVLVGIDARTVVLASGVLTDALEVRQLYCIHDRRAGRWWTLAPEGRVVASRMFPEWIAFQHGVRVPGERHSRLTGKYTICSRDGEKRFELGPPDDSTDVEVLGIFGEDLFVRSDDKIYRADIARETGITNIRLILDGSFPENAHVKVRYAHWVLPKPEDKPKPKEAPEATAEQNAAPESDPAAAAPVDDAQ